VVTASLVADAFDHHRWATLRLIQACETLDAEQLDTAVPGTYGSIIDTMRHVVEGDATYLAWLTADDAHVVDTATMELAELRAVSDRTAAAWATFLAREPDGDTSVRDVDEAGWRRDASVGVRLAQALHHGTDHRSQICTALTTLGIEPPQIDVWAFGAETGRVDDRPPA